MNFRGQGEGEFTWRCVRCDSFPEMKWEREGAADAGMSMHLGSAHSVGSLSGSSARPPFGMRKAVVASSDWTPVVDLGTARPLVFKLLELISTKDGQSAYTIVPEFSRLGGRPQLEEALHIIQTDPDCLHRPWIWLAEVQRQAIASGDDVLAAASLYWALH